MTIKLEINENLININLTPLKQENNIICEYDIKKEKDDEDDYLNQIIINSYEGNSYLEEEIKEYCELYLNNQKIDFCYKYKFPNDGKYKIRIIIKKPLLNTHYMFYECYKLNFFFIFYFNYSKLIIILFLILNIIIN